MLQFKLVGNFPVSHSLNGKCWMNRTLAQLLSVLMPLFWGEVSWCLRNEISVSNLKREWEPLECLGGKSFLPDADLGLELWSPTSHLSPLEFFKVLLCFGTKPSVNLKKKKNKKREFLFSSQVQLQSRNLDFVVFILQWTPEIFQPVEF